MRRVAVIMAGGSGERFWPVSRRDKPKQLLKLTGGQTMIEEAVERVEPLVGPGNVLIATSRRLAPAMREALPNLPPENILGEPSKRNTAACLAFAAAHAARFGKPEEVAMAVLTADHAIGQPDLFRQTLDRALSVAEGSDLLVTLGVRPTRAETGYGYIEAGDYFDLFDDPEEAKASLALQRVLQFTEKPSLEVADEFLKEEKFLWNSGMFFWRVSSLEAAFRKHLPGHAEGLAAMRGALENGSDEGAIDEIFEALESVSIDKGVMEKASGVAVLPAEFPWDDVGEWSALLRFGQPDENGNATVGDVVLHDCQDTVAYNAASAGRVLTAAGLREQIIVMTDEATMVAPLRDAQRVKHIVGVLRDSGRDEHL